MEQRYSTNELELLAVVWALEHFKYYLYGSQFTLQTDHQALLSALKENRGNKTYQSRLTRWVDRLLPFHSSVEHIPGKNLGFADYLSRDPSSDAPSPSDRDKNFVINTIEEIKHALLRANIAPNGAPNKNAEQKQSYDVTSTKHAHSNKTTAFRQVSHTIQSLSPLRKLNYNAQIKHTKSIQNLVAITTRANPTKETFKIPIQRRFRAPNKNKIHMEQQPPNLISVCTQTDSTSNKGRGLDSLDPTRHEALFTVYDQTPTPLYRENLNRVFNEEFIAQAPKKELSPIIEFVKNSEWEKLKAINSTYYRIRRDLSVSPSGCLIYDNKLVIPNKLKGMAHETIHNKHPGQAGMLALAQLIWYPHIHSDIVAQAQACRHCTEKGKNLKPLIPNTQVGNLPPLSEPNEEVQMDFAGPIPFKDNALSNYILVTVDRLSRYPHAEVFNNCDSKTAIEYLDSYFKVHGIPRSIRCDQAQAFKAREFEIYCKNKNTKLILAPAGDHRGTGMVERLIQTIKRRLAVLDIDSKWTKRTLSQRVANVIENIRLIPNATTKTSPFEAHFGRKPNTEISNIVTKPSHKNLTYKKLRSNCLDKKILKQDVLTNEEMWRYDGLSEDNLDIAYKEPENPTHISIDSDESDNMPLRPRSPRKITPSEIHFTIGDKTTKLVVSKRNVAKKTITRKTKEPRPTLAPQWNIIPDGTITNYTPHTITVDTPLRKNTVIRKSDIVIATETKPRLIHMVACKTVDEYKRNQEKIRKFCLEEARNNTSRNQQQNQGPSAESIWTKEKVKKLAQTNQQQQQRTPKRKAATKPAPPRTPKTNKRKLSASKSPAQVSFNMRAQQAALNYESELPKKKHPLSNKVVQFTDNTNDNPETVIYNIQQNADVHTPFRIVTSSNPSIFSDPAFTNSQDRQLISSETDLQEECPISIIPAPSKSTTKTTVQVQMDTTEDTATEIESIHMDQNIDESTTVKEQLKPPSVIFLDSPNGDPEGTDNNHSQLPHSTNELENEENQAISTSCDPPSGTSSVYATPPMSPYKRENSDSCTSDM